MGRSHCGWPSKQRSQGTECQSPPARYDTHEHVPSDCLARCSIATAHKDFTASCIISLDADVLTIYAYRFLSDRWPTPADAAEYVLPTFVSACRKICITSNLVYPTPIATIQNSQVLAHDTPFLPKTPSTILPLGTNRSTHPHCFPTT